MIFLSLLTKNRPIEQPKPRGVSRGITKSLYKVNNMSDKTSPCLTLFEVLKT